MEKSQITFEWAGQTFQGTPDEVHEAFLQFNRLNPCTPNQWANAAVLIQQARERAKKAEP